MQAQIACVLGLVTCHLNQSKWQQAAARVKKVIRKGLKRARSLLSGIRSLIGNTILRWVELKSTEEQLTKLFTSVISHQLGGRRVVFKFDWEKKWEKCVGTTDSNFHGQRNLFLEQQLYYLIMRVFWRAQFLLSVSVTVRLRVQIRVRLDSPLMNWTSSREYLEVSNVFAWYKANGSVCWLSWELNLFLNVFITFAIRSWLLLLCYWLHPVINPRMRGYYKYWKVKKSIGDDLWSKI